MLKVTSRCVVYRDFNRIICTSLLIVTVHFEAGIKQTREAERQTETRRIELDGYDWLVTGSVHNEVHALDTAAIFQRDRGMCGAVVISDRRGNV